MDASTGTRRYRVRSSLLEPGCGRVASSWRSVYRQSYRSALEARLASGKARGPTRVNGWVPSIEMAAAVDAEGTKVHLRVSDNAGGIPGDVLPRVFEPFFTTKPVGQGTGSGLAISRSILQDCGGSIEIDNRPGEGGAFTVVLPVSGGQVQA